MPTPTASALEIAIKLILLGDSGSGKTGALLSLIEAGYRLLILDYDGEFNSSWLVNSIRRKKNASELLERIHYASLSDPIVVLPNGDVVVKGVPQAFSKGLRLLTNWKIGDEDLGKSDDWGLETVVVIDSFSFMCRAAFRWATSVNTNPDERSTYYMAQKKAEGVLQLACSTSFKCHVILTAHMTFLEMQGGLHKALPSTIGKAFSPDVPKYFNSMLEVKSKTTGGSTRRIIRVVPDHLVELKNPVPEGLPNELPIQDGLATFFQAVRGATSLPGGAASKSAPDNKRTA